MAYPEIAFEWSKEVVAEGVVLRSFHTWIVRDVCIESDADEHEADEESSVFTLYGSVGGHHLMLDLLLLEGIREARGSWELCGSQPYFLGAPERARA
jgi:hypothetical protein